MEITGHEMRRWTSFEFLPFTADKAQEVSPTTYHQLPGARR